jgi:hypothetical protein
MPKIKPGCLLFSLQSSHYNDYPAPSANHKLHSEHEWEINAAGNLNKGYHCGHPTKCTVTDLMLKLLVWIIEIKNHLQLCDATETQCKHVNAINC